MIKKSSTPVIKTLSYGLCIVCLLCTPSFGADKADNIGKKWHHDNCSWQEKEMNYAGVKGWYIPLGPTGIRAMPASNPCYWKVMYVFKDTPAFGKVKAGDVVAGANGKRLNQPCKRRGETFTVPGKPWRR